MAEEVVKANKAYSEGNFLETVCCFTEAIKVFPTNHVLYSIRSAAYASSSKFNEALIDAQKTVKLKLDWAEGYVRLEDAYFGLAVLAYENGNELKLKWLQGYSRLGAAYIRLTLLAYKKGLKLYPKDVPVIKHIKSLIEDILHGPEFYTISELKGKFFKDIVEIQKNMIILTGKDRVQILESLITELDQIETVEEDIKYEKCIRNCDITVAQEPATKEVYPYSNCNSYCRDAVLDKFESLKKGIQNAKMTFMLDLMYTEMLQTYQSRDCGERCTDKIDGESCKEFVSDVTDTLVDTGNYQLYSFGQAKLDAVEESFIDNCRKLENLKLRKNSNTLDCEQKKQLEMVHKYYYDSRMQILSNMSSVMKENERLKDELQAMIELSPYLNQEIFKELHRARKLRDNLAETKRIGTTFICMNLQNEERLRQNFEEYKDRVKRW